MEHLPPYHQYRRPGLERAGRLTVMMPDQAAVFTMARESRDMMEQLGPIWDKLLHALRDASLPAVEAAQQKLTLLRSRHLPPHCGAAGPVGTQAFALEPNSLGITRVAVSFLSSITVLSRGAATRPTLTGIEFAQ